MPKRPAQPKRVVILTGEDSGKVMDLTEASADHLIQMQAARLANEEDGKRQADAEQLRKNTDAAESSQAGKEEIAGDCFG